MVLEERAIPEGGCMYCKSPMDASHKEDCVCLLRSVVVAVTVQMVVTFPRIFSADDIEFSMNGSSSCADNLIEDLIAAFKRKPSEGCFCARTTSVYVREASEADHARLNFRDTDAEEFSGEV